MFWWKSKHVQFNIEGTTFIIQLEQLGEGESFDESHMKHQPIGPSYRDLKNKYSVWKGNKIEEACRYVLSENLQQKNEQNSLVIACLIQERENFMGQNRKMEKPNTLPTSFSQKEGTQIGNLVNLRKKM